MRWHFGVPEPEDDDDAEPNPGVVRHSTQTNETQVSSSAPRKLEVKVTKCKKSFGFSKNTND